MTVHTPIEKLDPADAKVRRELKTLLHPARGRRAAWIGAFLILRSSRSEEHTSELQSLMRISYAVFCLKNKHQYMQHQRHSLEAKRLVQTASHQPPTNQEAHQRR